MDRYRVQINLSPEEEGRLRALAEERGISMAAVVREALTAYDPTPPRGLLELAGAFSDREGRTDVAERHDAHIADAIEDRLRSRRKH